jgi:phage terminase large subunit-like protein
VERDYPGIAARYVRDVLGGRTPACKWVKLACERQRQNLTAAKSPAYPYRFDRARATRICQFVEQLPHIKGPKAGLPMLLEPWQVFIYCTAFGWVVKKTGKRRFRRVYIEVPRGNGKSAMTSPAGMYLLAADGEAGAEVYSAATTRDQARIVFGVAQTQARKSPALCEALGVEVHAQAITVMETASKFVPVSRDADTLEGFNVHGGLIDELHAHKTREVYDVIETGAGKRDQSMIWVITTAGTNRSGICYEVRGFVCRVLEGTAQDEQQFGIIYTIDAEDDPWVEASWIKANPNWGVSVEPEYVGQLAGKAMQVASAQPNFLTKHLNVWVNADVAWMDMRAWAACEDRELRLEYFAGQPCIVSLDLATKIDLVAMRFTFGTRGEDGVFALTSFGRFFIPEARIEGALNDSYAGWERDGYLVATPGEVVDFGRIEDELRAAMTQFEVLEVAFDPWQATQLAQRMQEEGAPMVELRQIVQHFSPAMKEIDALVRSGRYRHTGCPVMTWCVSNVVCHTDAKDNIYPRKERPENKIDGVVAEIMAVSRWISRPEAAPAAPSVWSM